jgi:hypothetical protein
MAHPTGTKVRTAVHVPTKLPLTTLVVVVDLMEVVDESTTLPGGDGDVVAVDTATELEPDEHPTNSTATTPRSAATRRPAVPRDPPMMASVASRERCTGYRPGQDSADRSSGNR